MERLTLYATASRGTEDLLAEELTELGAKRVRRDRGGVRFAANLLEALRICVWTRIAMRVLYPLVEIEARGAEGLYTAAASVPWEEYLTRSSTFAVEAALKESEHAHSGFVALKIKDALVDRLREKLGGRPDVDTHHPDVQVVARLAGSQLSLSLDLCGDPLFRRGYRRGSFTAPLKETLAAAILRASGYTGEEPLWDPLCGSGTLLVEGAWIAMRRAPNGGRPLGIERWPHLGAQAREALSELRAEAKAQEREPPFPILGSNKSEDAIAAAKLN
ncbi:MAG TPA: THUMP domain-containing protein, partial [Myxococcaceae bacterium]|nr:THUMP domain-containing protein [Myxococcaceae bacterium]